MKCLRIFYILLFLLLVIGTNLYGASATGTAPFINTWLVAGTWLNSSNNSGYNDNIIGETTVRPKEGMSSSGKPWKYFDDRIFSRNYDDYQDLYSYYVVKKGLSATLKVAYAHVYVYSTINQSGQLRIGADSEFKAWINGNLVSLGQSTNCEKDMVNTNISLVQGWNSLLIKIANQSEGYFGFFARICDINGNKLNGLTYSVNGGDGSLAIATKDLGSPILGSMPIGYRGWPYAGLKVKYLEEIEADRPRTKEYRTFWAQASNFIFNAQGGTAPYRWSLVSGNLPSGLILNSDGSIDGKIYANAIIGDYTFNVKVTDLTGNYAIKTLTISVLERPNKWYDQSRLTALIHGPADLPDNQLDRFAQLMKRQGYEIGILTSYGNGGTIFEFPSRFEPNNPHGDVVGKYKTAFENNDLKLGMYIGKVHDCPQFTYEQLGLMLEDAIKKYHPAVFWFDWGDLKNQSLDAIYSMIKSYDPNTLIVLNGMVNPAMGDWDIICIENMGGEDYTKLWDYWPGEFNVDTYPMAYDWAKENSIETWRVMINYDVPDWQEMLRLQISLIGIGSIANIDHSPTVGAIPGSTLVLEDSPIMVVHMQMADWANPVGLTPLYTSYTKVNPGPFENAVWGYNLININRDKIYLHFIENPVGKTGLPNTSELTVGPVYAHVNSVVQMNNGNAVAFTQVGKDLTIYLNNVVEDPVDTILSINLNESLPAPAYGGQQFNLDPPYFPIEQNIAYGKPAKLLNLNGTYELPPWGNTAFASLGVDKDPITCAQASNEIAWTFEVDLEQITDITRVAVKFNPVNYSTEYKIIASTNKVSWTQICHETGGTGASKVYSFSPLSARYVRIQSLKPDNGTQPGVQMSLAELEVYNSPVYINNPSFEANVLAPESTVGNYSGYAPTGWTSEGGTGGVYRYSLYNAPDGNNVFLYNGSTGVNEKGIKQTLTTKLKPNTKYTLSVDVLAGNSSTKYQGNEIVLTAGGTYIFGANMGYGMGAVQTYGNLINGATPGISTTNLHSDPLTPGKWYTVKMQCTTGPTGTDPNFGQYLRIYLRIGQNNGTWTAFDNVKLDASPVESSSLTSVAYYRGGEADGVAVGNPLLNGTLDSSGNGRNLNGVGGSITCSNIVPLNSVIMSGLSYDMSMGYLFNQSLVSTDTDNIGMEMWVKANTSDINAYKIIAHNGCMNYAENVSNGFGIIQYQGNYIGHLAGAQTIGGFPVEANKWTHLALVTDMGAWGGTKFFVNGVENGFGFGQAITPVNTPGSPARGVMMIGGNALVPGWIEYFDGFIDEVKIFNIVSGQFDVNDLDYSTPTTGTLTGTVYLQNYIGDVSLIPVTVELNEYSIPLNLDANGNFSIYDVPANLYNVRIKASNWLAKVIPNVEMSSEGNEVLTPFSLINGDVVDNNEIDFSDINAVRAAYGSFPGDGNWNERADADGSGEVDFTDINIVRSNYGEIGE